MEHTINWQVKFDDTSIENGIRIKEFLFVPIITTTNHIIWATKPVESKSFFFFSSADAALRFAQKWLNAGSAEFWESVKEIEKTSLFDVYNYMGESIPMLRERMRLVSELKKVDWDF